jgi:hypothetical protein
MPADLNLVERPATTLAELREYLRWLQDVWLPSVGHAVHSDGAQLKHPRLTLIEGGKDA